MKREPRALSDLVFYVAGPMTNYKKYNYPLFERASDHVRLETGAKVLSPHEIDHGDGGMLGSIPWEEYIRTDLEALLSCDAIVLLPEWEKSRGARLEYRVALELGYYFFTYKEVDERGKLKRKADGNLDVLI